MPISPSFVSERDFWCSFGIVARHTNSRRFLEYCKIFHRILQSVWNTSICWNLPFSNKLLSNKHGFRSPFAQNVSARARPRAVGLSGGWRHSLELGLLVSKICRLSMSCSTSTSSRCLDINLVQHTEFQFSIAVSQNGSKLRTGSFRYR